MPGEYTDGDFDKSGDIQFPDFVLFAENFGKSGAGGVAAAVPEPTGLTLLGFGCLLLSVIRRRR